MLHTIALITTLSATSGLMGHCGKPVGGRMHHARTRTVATCAAPVMMTTCGTAAPAYAIRTMAAPMGRAGGTTTAMPMMPAPAKVAPTPMAPAKGMPTAASKAMPMAAPASGAVYASPSAPVPPAPEVPPAPSPAPAAPAPPAPAPPSA